MNRTRRYIRLNSLYAAGMALIMVLALEIGIISKAHAQAITGVIDLGDEGGGIAVNSSTNRVYSCVGGNLKVFDSETLGVTATITLPQNYVPCQDVAVNPLTNRVYATGYNTTYVINGYTNKVLANLDTAGDQIAVNTATNRIYIASKQVSPYTAPIVLHVLNGVTNSWLPDIPLGTPTKIEFVHLAANPTTNLLYITYSGDDDLRVLDGDTHAELSRVHLNNIEDVAINQDTNRVYVGMRISSETDVAVLDGTTHEQIATIHKFGSKLHVNPLTNRIYGIGVATPGSVLRVADLDTNNVVGYIYQDGGWEDFDIHLNLGILFANHLSYPSSWNKKMTVIQDASPTTPAPEPVPPAVIATFDLPEDGSEIAVNPATNRFYVGVNDGVSVYDAISLEFIFHIPLDTGHTSPIVNAIEVDGARNRVYAVTPSGTYVINGTNNQVIGTLGNNNQSNGEELAVNPANGRVYVSETGFYLGEPDLVKIYDGVSLAHIRTINLGTSSYYQYLELAVNPATGYAYCTYSLDNGLHIISPVTDNVVQTISFPDIGHVVANPATNRIYVWVSRTNITGAVILDGNTHAELGTIKGANGPLEINPQTDRLYGHIFETLFQSYDGESGTPIGHVFLDGKVRDYSIHTGLSRLYVTFYEDTSDSWASKVAVIQDTGQPTIKILSINLTGTGSGIVTSSPSGINCGSSCSYSFADNTVVTLTATPAVGSIFTGWSGGSCSGNDLCMVTMNAAKSVTAGFEYLGIATISGNVGAPGTTLRYEENGSKMTTSDIDGEYSFTVTSGWSGTVSPINLCYIFSPTSREYTSITADMFDQDYNATPLTCEMNFLPMIKK